MKKPSFYLTLLTFCWLFAMSCTKADAVKDVAIRIDIQYMFNVDTVKIYLDGQKEFDNVVTTSNILSFAGGFSTVKTEGRHELKVMVNNNVYTEAFTLTNTLYVGVRYNMQPGQQLTTVYSNKPFEYR